MTLVPVLNVAQQVVITHSAHPNIWGYYDGTELSECGEPKYTVPKYTALLTATALSAHEGVSGG